MNDQILEETLREAYGTEGNKRNFPSDQVKLLDDTVAIMRYCPKCNKATLCIPQPDDIPGYECMTCSGKITMRELQKRCPYVAVTEQCALTKGHTGPHRNAHEVSKQSNRKVVFKLAKRPKE